ncbi:hypothetical protein DXG01_004089 [Tephrocybe rancida]|nr:hypothetical protein DXG01_004089 [Tephrocybe rancida]
MASTTTSPSKSEQLLRNTLLRSDSSQRPTHKRRHSHAQPPQSEDELTRGSFLFRTALVASAPYGGDAENDVTHRAPSPSPSSSRSARSQRSHYAQQQQPPRTPVTERTRKRQSLPASLKTQPAPQGEALPMTPPERALRQRLERVLQSSGYPSEEQHRDRKTSNEVRDESNGWPWGSSTSTSAPHTPARKLPPALPLVSSPYPSASLSSPFLSPDTPALSPSLPRTRERSKSRTPRTPAFPHDPSIPPVPPLPLNLPAPRTPRAHTNTLPDSTRPKTPIPVPRTSLPSPQRMPTPPPTPPSRARASTSTSRSGASSRGQERYRVRRTEPVGLGLYGTGTGAGHVSESPLTYATHKPHQSPRIIPGRPLTRSRSPSPSPSSSNSQNTSSEESIPPLALPPPTSPALTLAIPASHPYPSSTQQRPFNARKASARLRSTPGYVSFASVEGLGVPPETPVGEEGDMLREGLEEERGRKGRGMGIVGVGRVMGWFGVGA